MPDNKGSVPDIEIALEPTNEPTSLESRIVTGKLSLRESKVQASAVPQKSQYRLEHLYDAIKTEPRTDEWGNRCYTTSGSQPVLEILIYQGKLIIRTLGDYYNAFDAEGPKNDGLNKKLRRVDFSKIAVNCNSCVAEGHAERERVVRGINRFVADTDFGNRLWERVFKYKGNTYRVFVEDGPLHASISFELLSADKKSRTPITNIEQIQEVLKLAYQAFFRYTFNYQRKR